MSRVRCEDEGRELQQLLEKNYDLLPGDQINPDDPRRWLLVKREMPVPDPSTGTDRWSIDFFFVDQDATPTFVECKRHNDTRSRRETMGQMLEYAANGHHYWTHDQLRELAEGTAHQAGRDLSEALKTLRPNDDLDAEAFFARVQDNLREGRLRLVFFLEESSFELRSVVDFLSKQMGRSEVLLVEARQYTAQGLKIAVPTLFGWTEQARLPAPPPAAASRERWDEARFFGDAERRLSGTDVQALRSVYEAARRLGCELTWGTGRETGSINVRDTALCPRSVLSVFSDGRLSLNFGAFYGTEQAARIRDRFVQLAVGGGLLPAGDYSGKYPCLRPTDWTKRSNVIVQLLTDLTSEFRAG